MAADAHCLVVKNFFTPIEVFRLLKCYNHDFMILVEERNAGKLVEDIFDKLKNTKKDEDVEIKETNKKRN